MTLACLAWAGPGWAQQPATPAQPATSTAAAAGTPASAAQVLAGHPRVFNGRDRQLDVVVPRVDDTIVIDGALDERPWQQAAVLNGFSKYLPVDGAPAEQDTEVLVWYSPTAIYLGVRARATTAGVRATLADRDHLTTDEHVIFFLDTFDDRRQAFVFAVNALGAQADGSLVEGVSQQGGHFSGLASGRETPDLSPDYVFQSRGQLTADGFQVEVRIPFKSLRYQDAATQDWGFNIARVIPAEGREDSWAPARRADASYLAQSGRLRGLTDLHRGLVLDLNPFATAKADGAASGADWRYDADAPELGMNVRWGVTANLTVNGTINPDFSQVESDAGQFQYDPRQALYYPEKRPFFLDAIEQFTTPNNLIYTRRIVAPDVAAKLTGKLTASTSVAVLTAVDDDALSRSGSDHPVFAVARLQQDIGGQSKLGFVYTDRAAGDDRNQVVGADARLLFHDIYSLQAQAAASRTAAPGTTVTAPLWQLTASRNGRRFGFRYNVRGIDEDFRAAAGFISRAGIAQVQLTNQAIFYGPPGSVIERFTSDVVLDGSWRYDDFTAGRGAQDRKLHLNENFTLRGGWQVGGSVLVETFGYDDQLYENYALVDTSSGEETLLPFVGTPRLPNLDYVLVVNTPQRAGVTLDAMAIWGRDENFYEWASADIVFLDVGALWRPTERLRVDGRYQLQSYQRRTDDSYVGIRRIPRLKLEYQMTRAIFLRLVAEYDGQFQDDLRDDSRTNLPIAIRDDVTGVYERALRRREGLFRADALFSYQPTPGTVVFFGYGSTAVERNEHERPGLRRERDGFFLKVSYLFRI